MADAAEKPRLRSYATVPGLMGGAYDAANRFDRALASWQPAVRSADGDMLADKRVADTRALDALRNDSFAANGQRLHQDSIVGAMYRLNLKPRHRILGLDDAWARDFQEEVEQKFVNWAESIDCWVDASRRTTFTGLVRLAVGIYVAAGETVATAEWMREGLRPYRTAIQMIDPLRLSNPQDRHFDEKRTRAGVRMDAHGAPLGYWIRRALPGANMLDVMSQTKWSYLRARNSMGRPQVIHIVEQDRPGQTRGISQLVSGLKGLRILQRFRDVTLQSAALQASFAAAVTSELPSEAAFADLGGGDVGDAIVDYAGKFLGVAADTYGGNAREMMVDGVKIPHLLPGTKLQLFPLGSPGRDFANFESALLRHLAATLNISFEQLSKDYTQTNYSSARAGMLETWKFMRARKKMVGDRFATTVLRLWFEEAVGAKRIEAMLPANVPNIYDADNMDAYINAEWIGAGHGQIDEYKETQAAELRIRAGLSTYEQEVARLGYDWREIMQQRKREQAYMEELGLMPDLDAEPETEYGSENDDTGRSSGRRRNDNGGDE